MKLKKMMALSLTLAVMLGLLAGCGESGSSKGKGDEESNEATSSIAPEQTEGTPAQAITNKNVTVARTYLAALEQFQGSEDINNNRLVQRIKEISGYNVKYEPLPKDNVSQKVSVILASGAVPDLLHVPGKSDYFKLAKQGAFEPLDDLIEQYMPNIGTMFTPEELDAARLDGKIYGIPVRGAAKVAQGVLIRSDILEELGLQDPKTLNEYYEVLKTIHEKKGIAPLTTLAANPGAFSLSFAPFASAFGVGNTTLEKDGKLGFSWIQPEYKEFLTTMKQWYDEGLIDQEFVVNKDVNDKMINGTVAFANADWATAKIIDEAIKGKGSTGSVRFIAPPVGKDGHTGTVESAPATTYVTIPTKAKNKEGAADYYNHIISPEIDKLIAYGIENEDYTVENGEVVQTAEQSNAIAWRTLYIMLDSDWSFNVRLDAKGFLPYYDQLLPFKQNREATYYAPAIEAFDTKLADLRNYAEENAIKFIMGKRSLDDFDKYVEEFNAKGGKAAIDAMNEWYTTK